MRPYRPATRAERDARAERRLIRAEEAGPGRTATADADGRQPFDWNFSCAGVSWSLQFEPNPRDVRQWRVAGQASHAAGISCRTGYKWLARIKASTG